MIPRDLRKGGRERTVYLIRTETLGLLRHHDFLTVAEVAAAP